MNSLLPEIGMFLANMGVASGYFFLGFAVAPNFEVVLKRTKWGAILFFLLGGVHRTEIAFHALGSTQVDLLSPRIQVLTVLQLAGLLLFIAGLYQEVVKGRGQWPLNIRPEARLPQRRSQNSE